MYVVKRCKKSICMCDFFSTSFVDIEMSTRGIMRTDSIGGSYDRLDDCVMGIFIQLFFQILRRLLTTVYCCLFL